VLLAQESRKRRTIEQAWKIAEIDENCRKQPDNPKSNPKNRIPPKIWHLQENIFLINDRKIMKIAENVEKWANDLHNLPEIRIFHKIVPSSQVSKKLFVNSFATAPSLLVKFSIPSSNLLLKLCLEGRWKKLVPQINSKEKANVTLKWPNEPKILIKFFAKSRKVRSKFVEIIDVRKFAVRVNSRVEDKNILKNSSSEHQFMRVREKSAEKNSFAVIHVKSEMCKN
jgi:hypothetical protein